MLQPSPRPPPMTNQPRPANRILTALPYEEFERLRPKLREINFHIGEIVYLPEQRMDYAYFINRGIISWLAAVENGNTVEAGVSGSEGIAGVAIVLGSNSTPNQGLAQTAACNRLHTLDQRLARWLLMTHDRIGESTLPLTQEFMSRMLGVRRAGVSVAANSLRQQGLIDYHRGDILVVDRA